MKRYRIILDTNVILAAMRSQTGASHRLLMTIGHPGWQSVVTPALMYEYEDVVRRPGNVPGLSRQDITDILDQIYRESHRQLVWFSWRPLSPDPGDARRLSAGVTLWYRSTSGTSGRRGISALKSCHRWGCSN